MTLTVFFYGACLIVMVYLDRTWHDMTWQTLNSLSATPFNDFGTGPAVACTEKKGLWRPYAGSREALARHKCLRRRPASTDAYKHASRTHARSCVTLRTCVRPCVAKTFSYSLGMATFSTQKLGLPEWRLRISKYVIFGYITLLRYYTTKKYYKDFKDIITFV